RVVHVHVVLVEGLVFRRLGDRPLAGQRGRHSGGGGHALAGRVRGLDAVADLVQRLQETRGTGGRHVAGLVAGRSGGAIRAAGDGDGVQEVEARRADARHADGEGQDALRAVV